MKKSIKKKLMLFLMLVLIIPMVLTFVITEGSMGYLKGKSETLLIDETLKSANSFTKEKSLTINEQLDNIILNIETMREYTEYVYKNEGMFLRRDMKTPGEFADDTKGKTIHWLPCNKQSDTQQVKDEASLLSNLEPVFEATSRNYKSITSVYITTQTGLNIGYDENVLTKKGLEYYDPRPDKAWYGEPLKTDERYISDTYSDSFGRGLMVTISLPYHVDGTIRGTITADINIEGINKDILNISIGEDGYAMLLSDSGSLISAQGISEEHNNAKEFLGENKDAVLNSIITTESAVNKSTFDGKEVYIIHNKVKNTGWKLAVLLPVAEIIAPAQQSNTTILIIGLILLGVYLCIILIMMQSVKKMCVKITDPIIKLTDHIKTIGDGNLDYVSEIDTQDEIQLLSESFEMMTLSMKDYIANLRLVTAEKERIGVELDVATKIQASMLPCIFPAFPERAEFDIYACMLPAKEVGGDFYDFFLIDDDHLGLVVADVSGKGVPAALFMVIAKTLLKNVAQTGLSPKDVLEKVNNQLCVGNEADMFVTVWLGILEISTGKLTCSNAGHEYPVLKREGGDYELIQDKHGFVMAGMEGSRYREYELQMNHGDRLFLYTDGVAEATNEHNELYGTDRMLSALNRCKDSDCEMLLHQMKDDIDVFVGQAPQFDDITMLSLELRSQKGSCMKKLNLAPTLEVIDKVTAFVEKELEDAGVSMKIIAQMNIAVDEIFSNIVRYSGASDATVGVSVKDKDVTLRFADNGIAYDPTAKPDPDVTISAEARDIGGLGIFMVKKSMDTMVYEYQDGLNILTMTKHQA
ncbi:MAG: SpoIIE family protein phosphatase [Oscillospiraceae bacterium]